MIPPRPTRDRPRSRGCVYVAILGASLLVTVLGLAALAAARVQGRSAVSETDMAEARRCAAAAIELGRYTIASNANWRALGAAGWLSNVPFGKGTLSLTAANPSGGGIATGPVLLTGTGVKGGATQMLSVTLTPQTLGWNCLDYGFYSGGAITYTSATIVADRSFGTNAAMTAATSSIQTNCDAAGLITGLTYTKSTTSGITARTLPDSTAFDSYIANGASLSIGSIPSVSGRKTMQKAVLSAGSNPYGGGNSSSGIYVLDCQNNAITIQNMRILGTLVILNPGAGSLITGSVRWDPATSNYPALLVRGDITIATSQTQLSESAQATNFNPSGTPYNGVTDSDTADSYPSSITGLIYCSGNATFQGYNTVNGAVVIAGTTTFTLNATTGIAGRLDLFYNGVYYTTPPPGFAAPTKMIVSPGSFVQVVN